MLRRIINDRTFEHEISISFILSPMHITTTRHTCTLPLGPAQLSDTIKMSSSPLHYLLVSLLFIIKLSPSFAYTGLFHTFTVAPSSPSSFNVTIVSDGFLQFCQSPYKIDDTLVRDVLLHHRGSPVYHTIAMNVAIVDIAGSRVMVDTGVYLPADLQHQPNGGKLLNSMEMAGIHPASIDAVVLTHCHLDHSAGLVAPDGSAAFPKARVYVAHAEHLFWNNPGNDTERQDFENLGTYTYVERYTVVSGMCMFLFFGMGLNPNCCIHAYLTLSCRISISVLYLSRRIHRNDQALVLERSLPIPRKSMFPPGPRRRRRWCQHTPRTRA